MIGDSTGVRWWQEEGRKVHERLPMGSQTKFLSALLIYRVMQRLQSHPQRSRRLKPTSRVSEFASGWPEDGFGGQAEIRHLLSMTSGFVADYFKPGCVKTAVPRKKREWAEQQIEDSRTWERCMTEIAMSEFRYRPGTVFTYGPWHLFIAGGIAMKAMGLPLTKHSWEQLMMEEVYQPSGLWTTPKFGNDDLLPDLNAGMELSADEWQKIMQNLQFGNLLDETHR